MAVNIFLCVIAAVITLAIIAVNIYILVYFQNEEDKNTAIFPKIVTVFAFTVTCINVLMMPMDVANERTKSPNETGIPMTQLWLAIYIIIAILAFVVPFAYFYYEAEDPDSKSVTKQITAAIKWDLAWAILFFVPTVLLWLFLGIAEIPVTKLYSNLSTEPWNIRDGGSVINCVQVNCTQLENQIVTYRISYLLYLISMLTFFGTFMLIFFGGIGLAALPLDLINGFRNRPKPMKKEEYEKRRILIAKRAQQLLDKGTEMKKKYVRSGGRPRGRKELATFNQYRNGVFLIEQDFKFLEATYNRGLGPRILAIVWVWIQFFLGVIGLSISATWLIHIFLYLVPRRRPIAQFLNAFFITLDGAWGLFGTVAYAVYSFYLLWCVIKGNFKWGLRIPLLCSIHPMRVGETMMNAFLFNAWILLLASIAVVHFCAQAFKNYARFTGIDVLFNVGVDNLKYIKYFWRYYYWGIIALAIVTTVYLMINPNDRKAVEKNMVTEDLPEIHV